MGGTQWITWNGGGTQWITWDGGGVDKIRFAVHSKLHFLFQSTMISTAVIGWLMVMNAALIVRCQPTQDNEENKQCSTDRATEEQLQQLASLLQAQQDLLVNADL